MKKRLLTVAGATVLALSMSVSAFAADVVTEDKDYGTAGNAVENKTGWGSNLNGQFAIEDNQMQYLDGLQKSQIMQATLQLHRELPAGLHRTVHLGRQDMMQVIMAGIFRRAGLMMKQMHMQKLWQMQK